MTDRPDLQSQYTEARKANATFKEPHRPKVTAGGE